MKSMKFTYCEKFWVYGTVLPQIMAQAFISFQQIFTPGSLPDNPHNEFAVCGSDKRFSDSWPNSIEILFTDNVVLYTLHKRALSSAVGCLSHYWEKEVRKRLSHVDIIIIVDSQKSWC